VKVPELARFALHKLIVNGERTGPHRAKARRDLSQAGSLLTYLWEHRRAAVEAALVDLRGRGRSRASRSAVGAQALIEAHTELQQLEGLPAALLPTSSGNELPRIREANWR
jgi:hypothetical protein